MKLDKKGKEQLRKIIEERLQDVPQGQRIHIDKEILEDLLFDVLSFNSGDKIYKIKKPIWSGDFLSKIDLSEISFEDVSWENFNGMDYDLGFISFCYDEIEETLGGNEQYKRYREFTRQLDYKYIGYPITKYTNTNAKIDFKKSWEYKISKSIYISGCDFSGTDLSKNDMSSRVIINGSNLSNTGIKIVFEDERNSIWQTNLEGIDLSSITMNPDDLRRFGFYECNLRNTGLKIIDFTKESIDNCGADYELMNNFISGAYDGCYINGRLMKSKEERQETARQMRIQYQQFRDELVQSTLTVIDDQIRGMKNNNAQTIDKHL